MDDHTLIIINTVLLIIILLMSLAPWVRRP
jgi:hypothetical protein